jgi:hypothetical protein
VLSAGTALYLACLPLGWWWSREYKRKDAEAAMAAAAPVAATPAGPDEATPPTAATEPSDERPTRLN